ncbi:MAG: hypothetical protein GWO16_03440 [Gammaproteobacteria bacterium]|nr:hypothetical protein [Gammaproteobacteria bacterium]NIR97157.1 hypothetical protein [Gammaproteobacteria bacterium]NIT62855.1 hypothetical protein [Gammaproteobacteria bacterium]NIV19819.1 hypothetical protein [Gammaproteobacteria bacterium]NIX11352.1 hypothetical protein [Gammaproteobacteria bacterium]
MIGTKNIAFGFLYLVLTAALGPYMVTNMFPDYFEAQQARQSAVGELQSLQMSNFERDLEPLGADEIARTNTRAILRLSGQVNTRAAIDEMKGAHAHGNLEAVLNILAGFALCFMAAPVLLKHAISWIFIAGALLHSGALYLRAFGVGWAGSVLGTGIGPLLILLGLLLAGVAAAVWFRGETVRD